MPDELGGSAGELLALIECYGPLTRAELGDLAGLPRTTVTGLVTDLIRRSHVTEQDGIDQEPGTGREHLALRAGRPPRALIAGGPPAVVGVLSCSRSGIEAGLVTYPGEIVARASAAGTAERATDLSAIAKPGSDLLEALLAEAGCVRDQLGRVVISLARPVRPGESAVAVTERLGVPVSVQNDANLGSFGEAVHGAGRGHGSLVYVKLEHNVGVGLVINGRLHAGASGFAGELGHVQVRDDGELCACGGRGCLAAIVGSSLQEFVQRSYEERLALPQILALAAEREPAVRRVFVDLGRMAGRPLASFCTMFDPSAVVLGGSLGVAGQYVLDGIRESIDRHAAPVVASSVVVIPGELGDRAELLGGAALARQLRLAGSRLAPYAASNRTAQWGAAGRGGGGGGGGGSGGDGGC
jgi:predicted NBD/HSP70 family sugar kinase